MRSALTYVHRRITISLLNLDGPEYNLEEDVLTSDLGPEMTIDDLKGYLESETRVKSTDQRIYFNNQELTDGSKTLQQCHLVEDSIIGMQVRRSERGASNVGSDRPAQNRTLDSESYRSRILSNAAELAQLRVRSPELASAVNDPVRFRHIFEELQQRHAQIEQERQRRQALLAADPMNADAQREIWEMIREEQVMENLQNAVEHNPAGTPVAPFLRDRLY